MIDAGSGHGRRHLDDARRLQDGAGAAPPPPLLPSCTNAAELFPVMMQVQAICCTGGVCDGSAM
eukprot:SAG22_NODE_7726_length_713_cov_6.390879_1_plen_63_part_01